MPKESLAHYAFRRMYERMRQMERATGRVQELTRSLTTQTKTDLLGRVANVDDVNFEVGENNWYGREASAYAGIFRAVLAADASPDRIIYQEILREVDNELRNG